MTILILGGTVEARALAAGLAGAGSAVLTCLAGRVREPTLPVGSVRIGGFGGVDGLVAFLRTQGIRAMVDATHPFAAQISSACRGRGLRSTGVPLLRLERPGWADHPRVGRLDLGGGRGGGPGGRAGVSAPLPDHRSAVASGLPVLGRPFGARPGGRSPRTPVPPNAGR